MKSPEICRDNQDRRRDIRNHTNAAGDSDLNGIDYLEVGETQTILTVYFIGKAPTNITENNIRIDGGTRIRNISVKRIRRCNPKDPRVDGCLQIEVDRSGDFSTYTLKLVKTDERGRPGIEPLENFDPRYAQIDFSFKAGCPTDLDCAPADSCSPPLMDEPEIDYLAKDYSSFRRLMLDRLSLIMPDWKERHVPDLGITLVELLAYVGDYLSYYQDAVATEAYLETARQRISVRRHAKLVDYQLHEGCNARAWIYLEVEDDSPLGTAEGLYFISSNDKSLGGVLSSDDLRGVPFIDYEVFEPLSQEPGQPLQFYAMHNNIRFYTWHERECCLPGGATSATLLDEWAESDTPESEDDGQSYEDSSAAYGQREQRNAPRKAQQFVASNSAKQPKKKPRYERSDADEYPAKPPSPRARRLHLRAGDVLIFEEIRGPKTGEAADADLTHRHVVRLTRVEAGIDSLYGQPIVEIEWSPDDALPFPLCLSAIGRAPECSYLTDISIAHGNVLIVDHGRRVGSTGTEPVESWKVPTLKQDDAGCWAEKEPLETTLRSGNFYPRLRRRSLTHSAPFPTPAIVARQQFYLLSQFMAKVRARVERLWREVRAGRPLTAEEITELRTIFGTEALKEAGSHHHNDQAKLVEELLQHEERLLWRKARRVRSLAARAMAGYVLGKLEEDELAEMFGERLLEDIGIRGAQLLGPASRALIQDPREALPSVSLHEEEVDDEQDLISWLPQSDLLECKSLDRNFVVETDNEGRAHLRFGDGDLGRAPTPGTTLTANYRVGIGKRGNVGAEAISHIVFRQRVSGIHPLVRNPLPAAGGIDPEPLEEAKLFAPMTFRRQLERAITRDDYAFLAPLSAPGKIQQAAASPLRWTGSWYEVQVAIDPFNSQELDQDLRELVEASLYRYRRISHDLRVRPARYVSLDVALSVCVLPHYLRGHVEAELLDLFSNRILRAGKAGFFHPNNLSFGEGISLSTLVAAAQSITGVESVQLTRLQRLFEAPNKEIENGVLPLSNLEVARLDNDPSFPEHGKLQLEIKGGR